MYYNIRNRVPRPEEAMGFQTEGIFLGPWFLYLIHYQTDHSYGICVKYAKMHLTIFMMFASQELGGLVY